MGNGNLPHSLALEGGLWQSAGVNSHTPKPNLRLRLTAAAETIVVEVIRGSSRRACAPKTARVKRGNWP